MGSADSSTLVLSASGLGVAAILLLRRTSHSEGLWAVTVGTHMSGFVPVGAKPISPLRAVASGSPVLDREVGFQLIAGLVSAGIGLGAGLSLIVRRPSGSLTQRVEARPL